MIDIRLTFRQDFAGRPFIYLAGKDLDLINQAANSAGQTIRAWIAGIVDSPGEVIQAARSARLATVDYSTALLRQHAAAALN